MTCARHAVFGLDIRKALVAALLFAFLSIGAPATAKAACGDLSGNAVRQVFSDGDSMVACMDGDNWTFVGGGMPQGTIAAFAATSCPAGWTEYVAARGRFLRGIDNGAGNDPDGTRAAGNVQEDELKAHSHPISANGAGVNGLAATGGTGGDDSNYAFVDNTHTSSVAFVANAVGGAETRPKNVAVLFCEYQGGAPLVATPSGGAGEIQYADGSGGLTSDANIVVSGGNVGIGITNPSEKLEVNGKIVANPTYSLASTTTSFSTSSGSFVDVPGLSTTLTTHGKPVLITVNANFNPLTAGGWARFTINRDGTNLAPAGMQIVQATDYSQNIPVTITYVDVPAAGAHTYKVQVLSGNSSRLKSAKSVNLRR